MLSWLNTLVTQCEVEYEQSQPHLGPCQKRKILGLTSGLLNWNLSFSKIPQVIRMQVTFEKHCPLPYTLIPSRAFPGI